MNNLILVFGGLAFIVLTLLTSGCIVPGSIVASTEMSTVRYGCEPHDVLIYDNIRVYSAFEAGDDISVRPVSSVARRLQVPGDISVEQCERIGGRVIAPFLNTCDESTALPQADHITDGTGARLDWYYTKDGIPLVRVSVIPDEIRVHFLTGGCDIEEPEPWPDPTPEPTPEPVPGPDARNPLQVIIDGFMHIINWILSLFNIGGAS